MDTLRTTFERVKATAGEVASAAGEIESGAADLSLRTEQQASSLEQTAATTEQLAASVKASAQACAKALGVAREAQAYAEGGGDIVAEAVRAMERIEEASRKIADITAVIDEIAFQTNLLALNAAVEAARAGDAGKGFAVVATEVRTLAQRASGAAKDVGQLITSSSQEVVQGVNHVRRAGESLDRIVAASRTVADTVGQLASAASEQASGIDEMSQTIAHLDEITQQNASLAGQSAASAAGLSSQVAALLSMIEQFAI